MSSLSGGLGGAVLIQGVPRPVDLVGWAGGGGAAVCRAVQYSAASVDDGQGGGCCEEGRGEFGLMLAVRVPVWSCGDGDRMESWEWRSVSGENTEKSII